MSNSMRFVTDLSKGILGDPDSPALWTDIVNKIPDEVLLRPDVRILNVACGHGTEADIIVRRMVALGISKEKALSSIYLLDKYYVFTNRATRRGYKNVIQADFLTWTTDMKFDVVIGNPPYQDDSKVAEGRKNNKIPLWYRFAEKATSIVLDNGYVAFVTPNGWLQPNSPVHKTIVNHRLTYAKLFSKSPFPGVGTSVTYWIQSPHADQVIIASDTSADIALDNTKFGLTPVNTSDFGTALSIVNKMVRGTDKIETTLMSTYHATKKHLVSRQKTAEYCYPLFHTNSQTLWTNKKHQLHGQPKVIFSRTGTMNQIRYDTAHATTEIGVSIVVKDETTGNNLISILRSNCYKFFFEVLRSHATFSTEVLKNIPAVDLTRSWTDAELYKHFNLTQDEIDLIEATVK